MCRQRPHATPGATHRRRLGAITHTCAVADDQPGPNVGSNARRRAALVASASVAGAALVGQLLAGDDPEARLNSLPDTPLSLPLAAWIVVAVAYYAISWAVVFRLVGGGQAERHASIWYLGLMAANELWNYLLFEFDDLWPATLGMVGFALLALMVGRRLWLGGDRVAFWIFVPYLVWVLGYDVPWILMTWLAER